MTFRLDSYETWVLISLGIDCIYLVVVPGLMVWHLIAITFRKKRSK